jgi:hypothetical protein
VTSGDAGRIADHNAAITQAEELAKAPAGATGTGAWLSSLVPDAVTQATGIGSDAKARLAQIALQKQIIGKSLEGGVLRKEDEIKYSKILITISDPPEVAQAKMKGLTEVLSNRRRELLDSLEDAGYNTDRFRARQDTKDAAKDDAAKATDTSKLNFTGLKPGMMRAFSNGQTWTVNKAGQPVQVK